MTHEGWCNCTSPHPVGSADHPLPQAGEGPPQRLTYVTSKKVARIFLILFAGVIVARIAVACSSTDLPFLLMIIDEELHPEKISWDGKTAWKRCDSAIAATTSWPGSPAAACAAMHLCVNEAPLSDAQRQKLDATIRNTPSCPEP